MATPELPTPGPQQTTPQPQQPPLTQPEYAAPVQTPPGPPAQPVKEKPRRNTIGLIALIAAAVGFIFACIPGALIVGWILLPIAFVLGLVSLFLKGQVKWMGVTALILSIIGTIVGFAVFFSVVAASFDESFGAGETTVVEESDDAAAGDEAAAADEDAADAGTRESPFPIGSVIENDEWRVVVNSVTLAATDAVMGANQFNEAPAEGTEYIIVNYSATYIGDDADGQMPAFVSVEYVRADGTTVSGLDKIVTAPDPIDSMSTLYTDATATGNTAFEVPSDTAGQGVLAITPGMFGDKVFVAVQ
ncbi:DUF4352 domain-containing protein [Microterricola viridarii]|uniref:DUF4352 domain-containing protein n=1 Tax=Microterricola viridarii TaxID=412690 RepID=A0A1H1T2L4_9MICO|nr:DUF4352 domain-containing protein [Microterricola viridarii]SDS54505.1 hypothetical protein SAMN04489834_1678 [Microterricola viridarii]